MSRLKAYADLRVLVELRGLEPHDQKAENCWSTGKMI